MPDSDKTDDAVIEVEQFLRDSGVVRDLQQRVVGVSLCRVEKSQGFAIINISHRRHPAVEFSAVIDSMEDGRNSALLHMRVRRLLGAASIRVSASNVFARHRAAVVRAVFVPEWD